MALGQYEHAEAELREGLRLEQSSWIQYANLGLTYLALNRLNDSRAITEEALLKRKLDGIGLHFNLYGLALLYCGNVQLARSRSWA